MPNGSGSASAFITLATSDANYSARGGIEIQQGLGLVRIVSDSVGTGTAFPINFLINGMEFGRIDTAGNWFLGGVNTAPAVKVVPVAN